MKKLFVAIVVLSIFSILIGCRTETNDPYIPVTDEELSLCGDIQDPYKECKDNTCNSQIDDCYKKLARDKKDPSICERIPQQADRRDWCFIGVALAKKDISMCDKVLTIKQFCYERVGEVKGDTSTCDKIAELSTRDRCYQKVAISKKDVSICKNIREEDYKSICYDSIISDKKSEGHSFCNEIQEVLYKDKCYNFFAEFEKDPILCDKIQNTVDRGNCKEYVLILSEGTIQPEYFTFHIVSDGSSSGAGRISKLAITFEGTEVVFANRSFEGGRETIVHCEEELNLETKQWKNTRWEGYSSDVEIGSCNNFPFYSSREEIVKAIQSGEINPSEKGCHYTTCYDIIEN